MSVYDPTGSGGVHMAKAISGGKKATTKVPAKKVAGAKVAKKMADKSLPPSMQKRAALKKQQQVPEKATKSVPKKDVPKKAGSY